jgi:hypothetical protein
MVAGSLILFSGNIQAKTVSIGSVPQGSIAYSIAVGVAKVALDKADMQSRVIPHGGPVVSLPLLNNGELDFSVSNSIDVTFAYKGEDVFKGRPQTDVRVVAALIPLRFGFFVRKDSEIKTISDLKNKKISSKFTKQTIVQSLAEGILASFGMNYDQVVGVPVPDGVRGIEDFMEGKVDAACFSVGSGKVAEANASVGGIRFLPVPNTPEALAAMRKVTPGALIATLEPAPNLPGIIETTNVIETPFLVLAGTKTPIEIVYKLVKELYENKELLVQSHKAFSDFSPDKMHPDLGLPFHEGALKFYKEKGL